MSTLNTLYIHTFILTYILSLTELPLTGDLGPGFVLVEFFIFQLPIDEFWCIGNASD